MWSVAKSGQQLFDSWAIKTAKNDHLSLAALLISTGIICFSKNFFQILWLSMGGFADTA